MAKSASRRWRCSSASGLAIFCSPPDAAPLRLAEEIRYQPRPGPVASLTTLACGLGDVAASVDITARSAQFRGYRADCAPATDKRGQVTLHPARPRRQSHYSRLPGLFGSLGVFARSMSIWFVSGGAASFSGAGGLGSRKAVRPWPT